MGIKFEYSGGDFVKNVEEEINNRMIPRLIEALDFSCQEVVANAKAIDTYIDQTGNLRSSIGYVIYQDGVEIKRSFSPEPASSGVRYMQWTMRGGGDKYGIVKETVGGSGQDGVQKGTDIAVAEAQRHPSGIVAVIVAGMDYALFVESKGYDVLTGSWLQMESILKSNLNAAGFKL